MRNALVFSALLALAGVTHAECACVCVNGSVQPICQSTMDLRPICMPQLCAMVPPSIAPIQMPSLPPLGTTQCRQVQMWNGAQYVWRQVCS